MSSKNEVRESVLSSVLLLLNFAPGDGCHTIW